MESLIILTILIETKLKYFSVRDHEYFSKLCTNLCKYQIMQFISIFQSYTYFHKQQFLQTWNILFHVMTYFRCLAFHYNCKTNLIAVHYFEQFYIHIYMQKHKLTKSQTRDSKREFCQLTSSLSKRQREPPWGKAFPESLWWVLVVYGPKMIFDN